ncbi:hypothetical protein ACFWPU_07645 [Streptomyces sp. NPDC058471]|uniref:hypothetical protein n=1 Tax=Streptomyces sp. NPDC058471 TaxID=3346516 RepID=UPI00365D4076
MAVDKDLIKAERSAEEARAGLAGLDGEEYRAQWNLWLEKTAEFQAAVTRYAQETGQPRNEVEMAAKKAVRHAEEDPVE